jgi:hypothetical protein
MSNLLILPLVQIVGTTGTNEDWLDGLAFFEDDAETMPINILGIEFAMQMRQITEDATVALEASQADGRIIVTGNYLYFDVPAAQMSTITPADYVFDVVGTDNKNSRIIVQGQYTVFEGVTRK